MYVPVRPTIRSNILIARFMFTLLAVRSPWERNPAVAELYRSHIIRPALSPVVGFPGPLVHLPRYGLSSYMLLVFS
jgi:hypothetical protein